MNDHQLQHEIEEALSVEPSPQFAAHVRARIAESRKPSSDWMRWSIAGAGLALVAVVIAFTLPESKETVRPVRAVEIAIESPEINVAPPPKAAPQRPLLKPREVQSGPEATAAEPEVVFDPRELAAYKKFVEGVQEERIDLAKLIEAQQAAAKPAPIEEIALMPIHDLAPIVIESLAFRSRRIEGGSL